MYICRVSNLTNLNSKSQLSHIFARYYDEFMRVRKKVQKSNSYNYIYLIMKLASQGIGEGVKFVISLTIKH